MVSTGPRSYSDEGYNVPPRPAAVVTPVLPRNRVKPLENAGVEVKSQLTTTNVRTVVPKEVDLFVQVHVSRYIYGLCGVPVLWGVDKYKRHLKGTVPRRLVALNGLYEVINSKTFDLSRWE